MAWCVSKGSGIVAHGRRGSVRVETAAWNHSPARAERPLPQSVDARADGRTTRLTLPGRIARVRGPAGTRRATGRVSLDDDEVLVAPDGAVETVLRFDGAARVTPPALADGGSAEGGGGTRGPAGRERADGSGPTASGSPGTTGDTGARVTVAFADATRVTVGFRDGATDPPTMTVPPTPEGVATALTHASAALRTTGPERSHPAERDHPPLVTLGETTEVPAAVRRATPATDIDLHLPASLSTCSLAAPLAFYLGATVHVADGATPRLCAPGAGVDRTLPGEDGAFADETAALLRRVFLLDCLVRDRPGERLAATALLDRAGLEASHLRSLSPAGRLAAYLDAPFDRIEADLPAWPLATYVDGGERTVRCLPHLLDRLSLVYPASASELDGGSLLRRALDGFYRGADTGRLAGEPTAAADGTPRSAGDVATVDRLAPDLCDARLHGWLAEGTPVEVFNTTPTAYRNRLDADREPGPLDIAVVCNDPELTGERTVAEIYRDRAADLPVDVSVHDSLPRHDLAALLERPHDFVHYIGHCEREGLRCHDGYLDAAELETVGARTFFLNACGSYLQGQRLVERGSVAGAVTLTTVLDRHAATVGTAFARLLIHGVDFERALSLARQQILTGSDYAVVGDGTYAPIPAAEPAVLHVTETGTGFEVAREVLSADAPGRSHRSPFVAGDRLDGRVTRVERDRAGTVALLRAQSLPASHDGRLYWSTDLADELAPDGE